MKRQNFLKNLLQKDKVLKKLRPCEIAIFNVHGSFGDYQVKVFEKNPHLKTRSVEINGHIHHLFVNNKKVEAMPTKNEIKNNLKGTVIMRDITVRLFDKDGRGARVIIKNSKRDGAHAAEKINLAGSAGPKIIKGYEKSEKLANKTYKIVQRDILKALEKP